MQDCVIRLGKWHGTAVAEARGRFFVTFVSRKQMLCKQMLCKHSMEFLFSDKVSSCKLAWFIAIQNLCMFKWPVFGRVGLVEKLDYLCLEVLGFPKKLDGSNQ